MQSSILSRLPIIPEGGRLNQRHHVQVVPLIAMGGCPTIFPLVVPVNIVGGNPTKPLPLPSIMLSIRCPQILAPRLLLMMLRHESLCFESPWPYILIRKKIQEKKLCLYLRL
jgi:hypothetical protein